jgi:hypothetical protein
VKDNRPIFINYIALPSIALLLSACGGGGAGDAGTGSLSLSVTDSPVLEDVDVCIHFTGITLHHADGDLIQIPYDSSTYYDATDGCINNVDPADPNVGDASQNNAVALSALQGVLSVKLMESEEVKAGRYTWIRLDIDESLSYVVDSGGEQDLSCPSCDDEQSGLKLNQGITVPAGGEAKFMIDIDLAKSLNKDPSGYYKLRPTLRLVDLTETGHIAGSVADSLIPEIISGTDTGCKVYVYAGHDITPDYYHDADNVLISAKVLYDPASTPYNYNYVAAYLPTDSTSDPTPYTVALTCDANDPEVDQDNDSSTPAVPAVDDVIFSDGLPDGIGLNADVYPNQTTVVDFQSLI